MKKLRLPGLLALLIFALAFPLLFPNPAITTLAIFTLLYIGAASGWNIFAGYTGYINLGYSVSFGMGAYTFSIICKDWNLQGGYLPFLLLPLCGLTASIVAVPLGAIALRTRRHTFVVITIAYLFIMQLLAYNLPGITEGSQGLFPPVPAWSPDFFNIPFYYISLAIALLAIFTSWWIRLSKYGLGLLAIRDDENRARGLGLQTEFYKLSAYVLSSFFAGMVGAVIVYFEGAVYPPVAFNPLFDVAVSLMAFLGGAGTLAGPIIGAFIMEPLQQFISLQLSTIVGLDLVVYGAFLLAVLLLLPEGIMPTLRRTWFKRRAARHQEAQEIIASPKPEEALLLESSGEG